MITGQHLPPLLRKLDEALQAGAITEEQLFDFAHAVDGLRLTHRVRAKVRIPQDHRKPMEARCEQDRA